MTIKSETPKKFSIFPIFLVVLIDMIGVGIVIPIVAPLFLSTNVIFGAEVAYARRAIILGLFIACYPLAQFFGSPILGSLSDKYGRKKILIAALIGTCIGYILFAIGILTDNIYILLFSRILDGFAGGSVTIAMSSIADISDEKTKVKRFGLIGMSFGIGMIIGPVIGGYLGSSDVVSWFNYATPFFFAAVLCLINIILFIFNFKETLHVKRQSKMSLLTGIRDVQKAVSSEKFKVLFIFVFLFTFGFSMYTQFFQVYLIEKFSYTSTQIGTFFGFMGLCIVMAQGIIVNYFSKKFSPQKILTVSALLLSGAIAVMLIPNKSSDLFFIIPLLAVAESLTLPNMDALVSNLASKDNQGEVLGINKSVQALAMAIPPLIAGAFAAIHFVLPVIAGSIAVFIAWLVFVLFFRCK